MNYSVICKKRIKELSKNYFFDMQGYGKDSIGTIRLVKRNSVYYNSAKDRNDLCSLEKGLLIIINNNLAIYTIAEDNISKEIDLFLKSNGHSNLIVENY